MICGDQNKYVCIFVMQMESIIDSVSITDWYASLSHYHCYHITGIWCYYIDLLERNRKQNIWKMANLFTPYQNALNTDALKYYCRFEEK